MPTLPRRSEKLLDTTGLVVAGVVGLVIAGVVGLVIAIAARFQELEALVAAGASASDGAASVASDVGNVEELDDEAWTKIAGKGKAHRAILLRKSREELAAKVRGKLGSVTSVKSPFFKKM